MAEATAAPAFLTTREVAELLRVRERKVYEMAAEGSIPCRRVTGKLLFPRAEIESWLSAGAPAALAPDRPPDVVAGSHDPLLDWAIRESGSGLATLFDGSLDGLARVAGRLAVAAGMHLFEPEREDWNRRHVESEAAGVPVVLVEWAARQRGLIVAPALASAIRGVADLAGRRVVRRQPSAGAGLLLDHLIARAGVRDVAFLPELARTETDAAAAVAAGKADAAPGLEAVARQFGLGFVPTVRERFDLLVDRRAWFEPPMQALFRFARTAPFAAKAEEFGGYDISGLGTVRWNAP